MTNKISFAEFIGYSDTSDLLTEDILVFLENLSPLSNKDIRVVGQLESGEIARLISASKPELKRTSISIAVEILSRIKAAGYGGENSSNSPRPQELIIKPGLEQMGLGDLLKLCQESPEQKREAWRIIANRQEYINANQKTSALAWIVNGNLDVERTVQYIYLMNDPLTVKQTPVRDKKEKLISLPEVLGIETRSYFHPLTGELLRGPDKYGIDWTQELSPEYHKAAIWALSDPNCNLHPGDSYNEAQELLRGQGVWSLVMAQYWQALDDNDSLAMSVSVYGNQKLIKNNQKTEPLSQQAQPDQEESYYEQLLREQSLGNESLTGYQRTVSGIYDHVNVSGYQYHLDRIVCLEGVNIQGHKIKGEIILPPRQKVVDMGYDNDIKIARCKSWREVAARAELI